MGELEESKKKYKQQLAPVLELLEYKKTILSEVAWKNFVKRTEQSIISHPHQYLPKFPRKNMASLNLILEQIFQELQEA
jgi:hypothetical protein